MLSFLDPRVWIVAAIAAALTFASGYLYGDHKRGHLDQLEKTAEIAAANQEARHFEQQRQDSANAASKVAAGRERQILADASSARDISSGLRNDTDGLKRASEKSLASALEALGLSTDLLDRCTKRYIGMAEAAQRADSEARELREAWPK